jgi:tetratricopeptide (TPR) repeat protein
MTPSRAAGKTGSGISPAAAIANAVRLLAVKPESAERQATEVLKVLPRDARALLVIGSARRRQGDLAAAKRILTAVAAAKHESAEAHYELGLTLAEGGERELAIHSLRRAAELETDFAEAWLALSEQLYRSGDNAAAVEAYDEHIRLVVKNPELLEAIAAIRESRLSEARAKLHMYLRSHPADLGAARLLGETLARLMRFDEAEVILAHCVRLAPDFAAARRQYAFVLYDQNKPEEAIAQFETLLERFPSDPQLLSPLAACHVLGMDYDKALPLLERLVAENPRDAKILVNYGQSLRIIGDRVGAIQSMRRAIAANPRASDAYWSLADLKTGALVDEDIVEMTKQIEHPDLAEEERIAFHYALGKAHEDRRDWKASFHNYAEGARHRRRLLTNDADYNTLAVERLKRRFTQDFLEAREDWGFADARPIFIVGLPRAGSTLIEQLLGSHSDREATMELSLMPRAAESLNMGRDEDRRYPQSLSAVDNERFTQLGEEYVARSGRYRKRKTARFIDKMPGNFYNVGLIKLMTPNAKIIDIRRDPMGNCFSVFKQYFFRGQNYSYDLGDTGRYYRDYVSMMAHYESVLPGFVHRVHYDELVEDTEGEVRRLLDFLDVDFQPACLNFWRSDRPVATHSSEQVRRPIYRDGLELWRNYEPWLDPLRESLGDLPRTWKQRATHRIKSQFHNQGETP